MASPPLKPAGPANRASPAQEQRSWAALMLAMLSLIGLILLSGDARRAVVLLAVTLLVGVAGLWLAITSMSRSRRGGGARPKYAVLATSLAGVGAGLSALALIVYALFWTQINQYDNCVTGAITVTAKSACNQQLSNSLQSSVHLLGG